MFTILQFKHIFLRVMMYHMRWMTRYFGIITRPLVSWYASQEVIACGLRSKSGEVRIIYTPEKNRHAHTFVKKNVRRWDKTHAKSIDDFSKNLVKQIALPEAKIGETHRVYARKINTNRQLHSPNIIVKESTNTSTDVLKIHPKSDGSVYISWEKAKQYDPMLYFLAIEPVGEDAIAGIYTRETFWEYPYTKKASLTIGNKKPAYLEKNKQYAVKFIALDYDGWVPYFEEKVFVI